MALIDDLLAAVDKDSIAATTALNAAIDKINATHVNIAAAIADAGSASAVKAHISGEDVTTLGHVSVPSVGKAVTPNFGPPAVPKLA